MRRVDLDESYPLPAQMHGALSRHGHSDVGVRPFTHTYRLARAQAKPSAFLAEEVEEYGPDGHCLSGRGVEEAESRGR